MNDAQRKIIRYLQIRRPEAVSASEIKKYTGLESLRLDINDLAAAGLVKFECNHWFLTKEGMALDSIDITLQEELDLLEAEYMAKRAEIENRIVLQKIKDVEENAHYPFKTSFNKLIRTRIFDARNQGLFALSAYKSDDDSELDNQIEHLWARRVVAALNATCGESTEKLEHVATLAVEHWKEKRNNDTTT